MNLKSGEIISQTVNREFANSSLPLESIATICFNAAKDGDTIYSFTISDGEMYFNRE